jgi:hypothetical protein
MNSLVEEIKHRLDHEVFRYTKKNGHTVAPCGSPRRCKRRGYECHDGKEGYCERANTIPEKLNVRLFAESVLHEWKKKPHRLKQLKKAWTLEYRFKRKRVLKYCEPCKEEYCSVNGVKNENCKLTLYTTTRQLKS